MTDVERAPTLPGVERPENHQHDAANYISQIAKAQSRACSADDHSDMLQRALRAAVALAEIGVPCFPCGESKRPATPRGFKDASSNPETLVQLWDRYPGPLVGVVTGAPSGLDVLDLDLTAHGEAAKWLADNQRRLPATPRFRTRRGGLHLLFQHGDGVRNSAGKIVLGVDVRGDGGYFVFWAAAGLPVLCDAPPAPWPRWLLDELVPARAAPRRTVVLSARRPASFSEVMVEAALVSLVRTIAFAREGRRNSVTFRAACRAGEMVRAGSISSEFAINTITEAAKKSGLDQLEAYCTARNGVLKGQGV